VLVGTTLEVLTERTRTNWRITRWRAKMTGQVIVIGYGAKGRAAVRTLADSGVPQESVVVIDTSPEAVTDPDDPRAARLAQGDRLILVSSRERPTSRSPGPGPGPVSPSHEAGGWGS
jgi:voltage-gated potassium channel Kch